MSSISTPFFVTLQGRGLIHIEGTDRLTFLQGLITQNVVDMPPGTLRYGALLTPQGKCLHDFFIHTGTDFVLLECDGGERARDLYDRLNRYRLRADVKLSFEEHHPVYAVFGEAPPDSFPDPRHPEMGVRTFHKPLLPEFPFAAWDERRIRLGIPDGSRDMVPGETLPLEARLDECHAIDFSKGCYMGQEMTARTHYRATIKKHLCAVELKAPLSPGQDIVINDNVIGHMRSVCGTIGLALLRDDALEKLDDHAPIRLLG